MSALQTSLTIHRAADPAPQPTGMPVGPGLAVCLPGDGGWLSVAQVAARLALSERRVRQCCERWNREGLAERLEDGSWKISAAADKALAPIVFAGDMRPDYRALNARKRERALRTLALYRRWLDAKAAAVRAGKSNAWGTEQFIAGLAAEGVRVSERTLRAWHRRYREHGTIIDGRGGRERGAKNHSKAGDLFLDEIALLWLDQRQRKISLCYSMALVKARDQGWPVCSYRSARRHIQRLCRSEPGRVILRRCGQKAFEDQCEPYIERDYAPLESNELWNADHHLLDVIVRVGQRLDAASGEVRPVYARPWLTAWQDLRSRKITGWIIRAADPNTQVILEAFRAGCRAHGVPQGVYTDNGKDFDCRQLTGITKAARWQRRKLHVTHDQERLGGIYAALQVSHIHAWPYHGQSKPIERFFGTLEDRFGRTFDTYCGGSTDRKPADLADHLQRGHAPSLERFTELFNAWLELGYHQRIHTGDAMGVTPDQAFADNLRCKRIAPDELLEVLLAQRHGPLKVAQNGVCYRGLHYGQTVLAPYFGRVVYLTLGDDLSQVGVWDEAGRFLLHAPANRRLPANASHAQLSAAIAEKRAARKALRAAGAARLKIHQDLPDLMIAAARQQAQPTVERPDQPPPALSPLRSDIEEQLPAIRAGIEAPLKKAVGDDTPMPRFDYQRRDVGDEECAMVPFVYPMRKDQEP